jgi:hypothetical protein
MLSDEGRMTETELNFFAQKLILIHAINDCCRFRIKSDKILVKDRREGRVLMNFLILLAVVSICDVDVTVSVAAINAISTIVWSFLWIFPSPL